MADRKRTFQELEGLEDERAFKAYLRADPLARKLATRAASLLHPEAIRAARDKAGKRLDLKQYAEASLDYSRKVVEYVADQLARRGHSISDAERDRLAHRLWRDQL